MGTQVGGRSVPGASVVLVTDGPPDHRAIEASLALEAAGLCVVAVELPSRSGRRNASSAIVTSVESIRATGSIALVAGIGRAAGLAAGAASSAGADGLVAVDGSLWTLWWRLPPSGIPSLLVSSPGRGLAGRTGTRVAGVIGGASVRVARAGMLAGELAALRRAALAGSWPGGAPLVRRVAAPVAVAMLAAPAAAMFAATPVGAAQRSGDVSVGHRGPAGRFGARAVSVGHRTGGGRAHSHLGGKKVRHRAGDLGAGTTSPHPHATSSTSTTSTTTSTTGTATAVDGAGMKWRFFADNHSSTSWASGALDNGATFGGKVVASTLHGALASQTMHQSPFDGYGALQLSVNGAKAVTYDPVVKETKDASCPPASGTQFDLAVQTISGVAVSRQLFVPANDHFARVDQTLTNTTSAPVTVVLSNPYNNLRSNISPIVSTSTGAAPSTADLWIGTFNGFGTGTTSTQARVGNVVQGPRAPVPLASLSMPGPRGAPEWTYSITLAPGQTRIVANYVVADPTLAQRNFDSFRLAQTGTNALECLSPAQIGELANFVPGGPGYRMVAADGGVFTYGAASYAGSTGAIHLNEPIVGSAATPTGNGYWLVAADGGVFSFGDAQFHGTTSGHHLNKPVVGMAATPDGKGYWLVAADGGVFAFGDATFHGSTGAKPPTAPVVGMAATPDGKGYWLVTSAGQVIPFGDAASYGSVAGALNAPIVGMAATPDGKGYWLAAADGGVFAFGDATFRGSAGALHLNKPIVGIAASPSGLGYRLVASDGGVFDYGDAGFYGSAGGQHLNQPIVGIANIG